MKTKHIIISLITAVTAVMSPSVQASELLDQHQSLWNDLEAVGVDIYVNDPGACKQGSFDGRYISALRRLDVCQDNYTPYTQAQWTSNDLDTLRHEAHHVLQDCNGEPFDSQLNKFFPTGDYQEFVSSVLTEAQINKIIDSYRLSGASDYMIELELEAFSVAQSVSAHIIGNKLIEFCEVSKK